MLTPDFQLKQDENNLTIIIVAPHARVSVLLCNLLNGFTESDTVSVFLMNCKF